MILYGMAENTNGVLEISPFEPELQEIVPKHKDKFVASRFAQQTS